MKNWKNNIENWEKISQPTAELYLNLAETRLNEQVKTAEIITNRTDKLLGISLTFFTIILTYLFSKHIDNWKDDVFFCSSGFALVILIYVLYQLIKNLLPFEIRIPGEDPIVIVDKKFIDNDLDQDEQYINLVLNQLDNYQDRINNNNMINPKRTARNKRALWGLVILPSSLILGFLVTVIFSLDFDFLFLLNQK